MLVKFMIINYGGEKQAVAYDVLFHSRPADFSCNHIET